MFRHTKVVATLALLILLALPVAPAGSSHGTGGDCGGGDTPPTYQLSSGVTCHASLSESATSITDRPEMGYTEHVFVDEYKIYATDADRVQITGTSQVCFQINPFGTLVANGDGDIAITVTGRKTTELGNATPKNPCPAQPGDYDIRATVTSNTRPTVGANGIPSSARPYEPFTFSVSGTDADANLKALGVRFGSWSSIDWQDQTLASASWSTDFTYSLWRDMEVKVYSRDTLGAIAESGTFFIDLDEDDCGFGHDVVLETVSLPFSCRGYLSPISGDGSDTFRFEVPSGVRPRASFDNGSEWGQTLRFTSPSGQVIMSGEEWIFGTVEAGMWSLQVEGDGDSLFYDLSIDLTGAQAPPTLSISGAPTAHQGDTYQIRLSGVDPNGQRLTYLVQWSDGGGSYWPVNATAASGETIIAIRYFLYDTTTATATVRAINQEGLMSDPQSIQVAIRLHNDCGQGIRFDLPGESGPFNVMPDTCSGTLGGGTLDYPFPMDGVDAFTSATRCISPNCKLKVTLETEPGLGAQIAIRNMPQSELESASSCGNGGCTTSAEVIGLTYPSSDYPRIFVRRLSGKGGYTVRVERLSALDGIL